MPMKKGRRKKGGDGTAIVNVTPSPVEKEAWPGEEKIIHKINKENDQELEDHKVEHDILRQMKTTPS